MVESLRVNRWGVRSVVQSLRRVIPLLTPRGGSELRQVLALSGRLTGLGGQPYHNGLDGVLLLRFGLRPDRSPHLACGLLGLARGRCWS